MSSARHDAVVVRVPTRLGNIEQVNKIVAQVLGKLGCGGCFSGFDIRFDHIRELVVDPKTLEVHEAGL